MVILFNKLAAAVVIAGLSFSAQAETLTGRTVSVMDGDTIKLLVDCSEKVDCKRQERIRLAQIDAPEKGQPYSVKSKDALAGMVFDKEIRVEISDTDRYGRKVGTIYDGDLDVNRKMVELGMAWVYQQYMTDKSLLDVEAEAKAKGAGLWAEKSPTPPWEWRREHRGS